MAYVDKPYVGRNFVPGFQEDGVAWNKRFCCNFPPLSISDNSGFKRKQVPYAVERLFRLRFLYIANDSVNDDNA